MRKASMRPPLWSDIDSGYVNRYTCRTLIRIDEVIYRLKGKRVGWGGPSSGALIEATPDGHGGGELRSHFPDWMFIKAAEIQNRWIWTRRVLSL